MKTETCKLYSRVFWIFLPNFIKIDPYNFELYRLKVCACFLRHSVECNINPQIWNHIQYLSTAIKVLPSLDSFKHHLTLVGYGALPIFLLHYIHELFVLLWQTSSTFNGYMYRWCHCSLFL